MGEQVGAVTEGSRYFAPRSEFERIDALNAERLERVALYADLARLNTLYMIATAGSGHIGSSFSSLDIVTYLYRCELDRSAGDVYFSSKGHDAPGLYAILIAEGILAETNLHKLRRIDGLPGHPDIRVPGIATNTGSLGMGISKAKGMAFANRLLGRNGRLFVMTGDGELQEGQIWESLISAANQSLGEITVVVDHNKIQSDFSVERTSSLGDLAAKFAAFGWHVERVDGHDLESLATCFRGLRSASDCPKVVIADTVKGKGVSFMEGTSIDSDVEMFKFHSGAPQESDYIRAVQELTGRMDTCLAALGAEPLRLQVAPRTAPPAAIGEAARLFPAYSDALLGQAERNERLVALDADLMLDMGLVPFAQRFPARFVECGIAEMDMVSQAGGMALNGLLPVVHSFSCFLSTRPNEQIYNNATEGGKVVYVGGLAGVLPGGPGHSHQSVRDISSLGSIPGLVIAEPSCPQEVAPLLDWVLNRHDGSSFLRMVSIPYVLPYELPSDYRPQVGQGVALTAGRDIVIVSAGMVMLAEAVKAAKVLTGRGASVGVINLPWLNRIDTRWLHDVLRDARLLVTIDNHYVVGGLGDLVLGAVAELRLGLSCLKLGLTEVPPSGTNEEVLRAIGLDGASIAGRIETAASGL